VATCYPTFWRSGVVATEIEWLWLSVHSVHFICYDVPRRLNRFTENVYFHEVEIRENPVFTFPPYALALTSKMVDVSTYENLDLLHVHYAVPHATSAYLARQVLKEKAPKIITTLHGTDITLVGNDRAYLPITRFSIMESDGVTAPSKYLKHATYDKLNIPTEVAIE
jgi:N-acetyl-alpha-D-glucosaminyl L-malate synthase BshA